MRLVILGGPGSGKGTQREKLCDCLKIPGVSMGEILREAITNQTPLGMKAYPYVEKGELLPDEIMIQFMRQRLTQADIDQDWVLEGYPRTAFQAEELDFLLEDLEQQLTWAIYLEVSEPMMIERSLTRSLFDDQPDVIARRIELFKQRTIPILEYYQGTARLLTIQGKQSPGLVTEEILTKLQEVSQ